MKTGAKTPVFEQSVLNRLYEPVEEGSGLPNEAYTDPDFFTLENQLLFTRTWCFAGFTHEIPNPGDAKPSEIAGQPILLVRGDDDQVRVFHNVCSHRGAQLLTDSKTQLKSIVCPNHAWTYHLNGRLRARPHFFGGQRHDLVDQPCHRADLKQIRCEVWFDWIFVNLSGDAAPLETHLHGIKSRIHGYDLGALRFTKGMEFVVRANWKLPIENFIEPYHVFSCHPWLNSFVSMEEREPPSFENHILFCGYDFKYTDPARGQGLPYFPGLSNRETKRGEWFVLFPNFGFEVFPDQLAVFVVTPKAVDSCRETIALYLVGDGTTHAEYAGARQRVIDNWHDLNQEDIGIVERMQAGRYSKGFEGGVLSPYWDPVLQHFGRLVVAGLSPQ